MATQEIKETNWALFCRRFEEEHRGTLVSLDVVQHSGAAAEIAHQLPLKEFSFEQTSGCSDLIRVTLGETPEPTVQHLIVDPIHVRLREEDGQKKLLQIDAESGSVEMRFSSGRIGKLLQDLQLE
jgi:hypothetical protein